MTQKKIKAYKAAMKIIADSVRYLIKDPPPPKESRLYEDLAHEEALCARLSADNGQSVWTEDELELALRLTYINAAGARSSEEYGKHGLRYDDPGCEVVVPEALE